MLQHLLIIHLFQIPDFWSAGNTRCIMHRKWRHRKLKSWHLSTVFSTQKSPERSDLLSHKLWKQGELVESAGPEPDILTGNKSSAAPTRKQNVGRVHHHQAQVKCGREQAWVKLGPVAVAHLLLLLAHRINNRVKGATNVIIKVDEI